MPPEETRILVVDDERQIRSMLKTVLSGNGYDIREAAFGSRRSYADAALSPRSHHP